MPKLIISAASKGLGLTLIAFAVFLHCAEVRAGEELYVPPLDNWKDVMNERTKDWLTVESIPGPESLQAWEQMVTVQIFYKLANISPNDFIERIRSKAVEACDNLMAYKVFAGEERGFPVLVAQMYCTRNKVTDKGEVTFYKAIRGKQNMYVVQWAKRTPAFTQGQVEAKGGYLPREELHRWNRFLADTVVRFRDENVPRGDSN